MEMTSTIEFSPKIHLTSLNHDKRNKRCEVFVSKLWRELYCVYLRIAYGYREPRDQMIIQLEDIIP